MLYKNMIVGTKLKFYDNKNNRRGVCIDDIPCIGSGTVEFAGPHFLMLRDDRGVKHTITRNDIISKKIKLQLL